MLMLARPPLPDIETAMGATTHRNPRDGRREVSVRHVTGFDRCQGGFPQRLSEQCRHALMNGAHSLQAVGLSMSDVVRVVYLLTDGDTFQPCLPLLRDAFGEARPAATLRLVGGFDIPQVKIEIELVARERRHTA